MRSELVTWQDADVEVQGARLAAQVVGDAASPPLVLVGGATWSRDAWTDDFCAALVAGGLRVVRYDQRDTGASTSSPVGAPGYTGADFVDDLATVVTAVVDGPALVLGLSMGGGVAQGLAAARPELVAGLVLVSTSPAGSVDADLPDPTPSVLASFEDPPPLPDWADRSSVVEWVVESERPYAGPGRFDEDLLRTTAGLTWDRAASPASVLNHEDVAASSDAVDLSAIDVPTLVVHGSADPLFPLEHGEALATVLGGRLLVLADVGHQLPPADTWPDVVEAVAGLAGRARW